MENKAVIFSLEGRPCALCLPAGEGPWPLAVLCGGDMGAQLMEIAGASPKAALFSVQADWERDYTSWPAPPLPGREPFTGEGGAYLRFLCKTALPHLYASHPLLPERENTALLGYSLGGLFALWALYQTDSFALIGAVSGSLWYDGWDSYMKAHMPPPDARVYLSLGKQEERGGGTRLGRVGESTRSAAALLSRQLGAERTVLEWNRGGHFTGIIHRWQKALDWCFPISAAPAWEDRSPTKNKQRIGDSLYGPANSL